MQFLTVACSLALAGLVSTNAAMLRTHDAHSVGPFEVDTLSTNFGTLLAGHSAAEQKAFDEVLGGLSAKAQKLLQDKENEHQAFRAKLTKIMAAEHAAQYQIRNLLKSKFDAFHKAVQKRKHNYRFLSNGKATRPNRWNAGRHQNEYKAFENVVDAGFNDMESSGTEIAKIMQALEKKIATLH